LKTKAADIEGDQTKEANNVKSRKDLELLYHKDKEEEEVEEEEEDEQENEKVRK